MTIAVLGIDLGKNSCSLVGLDAAGRVVLRRRMQREGVIAFGPKLPGCVVAMEVCCGAHHMGRALAKQGHTIRLDLLRKSGSSSFRVASPCVLRSCEKDGAWRWRGCTRFLAAGYSPSKTGMRRALSCTFAAVAAQDDVPFAAR